MYRYFTITFVALLFAFTSQASVLDSTGIEKKGGRIFVIHKVDPKETLFALSRRYNVSVDEIKKENPDVENGLQINQLLRIPIGTYKEPVATTTAATGKTHELQAKETLYSLSRMYNVSVDDLKKANSGLDQNDLKIGQVLVIPVVGEVKPATAVAVEAKEEAPKVEKKPEASPKTSGMPLPQWKPGEKITESGIAELIEDDSDSPKYLAFHKYAPVGTIIMVTNEANGQTIYVRVIGTLPNTVANEKVLIKISKKAFQKLSPTDKKTRVQLVFVP
ncbi:MAG: LysM peptidoglycan-binding domain-containing protein [Cytophagaceae bacterium]